MIEKYFTKAVAQNNKDKKGQQRSDSKTKNYKSMENRVTPGGSNFEEMMPTSGVTIRENGKDKIGKPARDNKLSKTMTREEYLMTTSKSLLAHRSIDFILPNTKETVMDDTIELNSTIKSSKKGANIGNMTERFNLLPPIDQSRLSNTIDQSRLSSFTGRNMSYSKLTTINHDRVIMNESKQESIMKSLIVPRSSLANITTLSKSTTQLLSQPLVSLSLISNF